MRVGDVFEWLAAACFAIVAFGYGGILPCLGVVGLALAYFGQCYAHTAFPWRLKRSEDGV
jgi:hypothetical protein